MSYSNDLATNQSHSNSVESPEKIDIPRDNKLVVHHSQAPHNNKKKVFNLDQEIFIDSHSSLILLKDISGQAPTPKFATRFLPALRNRKIKGEYKALATNGESKKNQENSMISETPGQLTEREGDHSPEMAKDSTRKQKEEKKELDVFDVKDADAEAHKAKYKKILDVIDSGWFNAAMFFWIFYSLFADDIRRAALDTTADPAIDSLLCVAMGFFVIEITLSAITKPEYRFSFFFYLDIISTASLVLDITWISNLIFSKNAASTASLARASRASRIGTRAGRIVRIIRLVKIFKFIKKEDDPKAQAKLAEEQLKKMNDQGNGGKVELANGKEYDKMQSTVTSPKSAIDQSPRKKTSSRISPLGIQESTELPATNPNSLQRNGPMSSHGHVRKRGPTHIDEKNKDDDEFAEFDMKESRVGKKLSELTTIRVVFIVLALLVVIPLCDVTYYETDQGSADYEVSLMQSLWESFPIFQVMNLTYHDFLNQQAASLYPVVYMHLPNFTDYVTGTNQGNLRLGEYDSGYVFSTIYNDSFQAIVDLRYDTRISAWLSVGRTLFVCMVLVVGSLLFSKDANDLALRPIERMIKMVNKIAVNPLNAKDETLVRGDDRTGEKNETVQIENAIIKIGALLALGFGDAGSEIIGSNVAKGGDIDAMIPGKKKCAIFGFCDIRNFTDATEVLQEEVMVFVNSIADIVHRYVDKYTGAANKNIGDAFLLVWKFPEDEIITHSDGTLDMKNSQTVQNIADLAVISFLKVYARINKDPVLLRYRDDARLTNRLPNYKVKMGFGLHVGWAIEGAIGSEFKIDASYLSPNVNMASRLEAATKQYGVPLLISGDLAHKLSKHVRDRCRLIDIVTVKGSKKPVEMWTIDAHADELDIAKPRTASKLERKQIQKEKKAWVLETYGDGKERASELFESDKDLLAMIPPTTGPFYDTFKSGFNSYIGGDWSTAKRKFEECFNIKPEDGPTKTLYSVLKENDFIAPEEWKGFRELTEK